MSETDVSFHGAHVNMFRDRTETYHTRWGFPVRVIGPLQRLTTHNTQKRHIHVPASEHPQILAVDRVAIGMKLNYSEKNLSHCHFVHDLGWSGINPGPFLGERTATNDLKPATARFGCTRHLSEVVYAANRSSYPKCCHNGSTKMGKV